MRPIAPIAQRSQLLRQLHAAGRALGLSHEDLHAACGVRSLNDLSTRALGAQVRRLSGLTRRLTLTPADLPALTTGASRAQRRLLYSAWCDAGYRPGGLAAWTRKHFGFVITEPHIEPADMRQALDEVLNILAKHAAAQGWTFTRTAAGYHLQRSADDVPVG